MSKTSPTRVTNAEIARAVSGIVGVSPSVVLRILIAMGEEIATQVAAGNEVYLRSLGLISTKDMHGFDWSCTPRRSIKIRQVKFKANRKLKRMLNDRTGNQDYAG